jgi:hypothetical protein
MESEAYTSKQASAAGSVVNFVISSMIQTLMMVTGTSVAKAIFTHVLPFDPQIFSREGFEVRRAVALTVFATIVVSVLRVLYPAGLPIALGGSFGNASSNASDPTPSVLGGGGVGSPIGVVQTRRDDLPMPGMGMPANSKMFHPF